MSSYGSMQYTIGTALERAKDLGHTVWVLVDGEWLGGLVIANDGIGVVLEDEDLEHAVVRVEHISAVRVQAPSPMRGGGARVPARTAPLPRMAS